MMLQSTRYYQKKVSLTKKSFNEAEKEEKISDLCNYIDDTLILKTKIRDSANLEI